jgi:glycosyltransferase involved in cell wall biosynthesis
MKYISYSWVLPIKNEALSLPRLITEIKTAMKGQIYEIIAVDDASNDNSLQILGKLQKQLPRLRIIHFTSCQGKWVALRTGLEKSLGRVIITLDSDLQDDPQEVSKLLHKLGQGYDVVSGWRKERVDPLYKVLISKLGNLLVSLLVKHKFQDLNSPFKVYRRAIIDNLPKEGSLLRFTLLFAYKLGYKIAEVSVVHRERFYGRSKFGMIKYMRIIYDLILVFLLFTGSGQLTKQRQ